MLLFILLHQISCNQDTGRTSEGGINSLLDLLPSVHCPSPEEVLKLRSQSVKPSPAGIFHICS